MTLWNELFPTRSDPADDEEQREYELIKALWSHLEANEAAKHIAIKLIIHYDTIISRLKYIEQSQWPQG